MSSRAAVALAPVLRTRPYRTVALCFAAALLYAIVRYNVFGGVAWSQLPLFIANKAISFGGAILLALSYVRRDRDLGVAGFGAIVLHVLLSMALLGPAHYPKLFDAGRYTFDGGVCILAGAVGLLLLCAPAMSSIAPLPEAEFRRWQRLGYWALGLGALHVLALGYKGWAQPGTWPAGMPPITVWSFVVLIAPIVRRWQRRIGSGS